MSEEASFIANKLLVSILFDNCVCKMNIFPSNFASVCAHRKNRNFDNCMWCCDDLKNSVDTKC